MKAPRASRERVVVVDDRPAIRALLRTLLKESAYPVEEASDWGGVLRLLRNRDFEVKLLLLDVHLPGAPELRVMLEDLAAVAPDSGILLMTGAPTEETDRAIAEGRVRGCLTKPFNISEFRKVVFDILETKA